MNNTSTPVNSSNIHNTNVEKIKLEVDNMLELLKTNVLNSETVLKKRFEYLFKTSPALFNFILKNHKNNPVQFKKNLDTMLTLIFKIQTSEISQHDASVVVGKYIGEQYIPQLQE
jgi:hypothetical protein